MGIVVFDKRLIEEGKWQQPYVHSNPKNFIATQNAHYNGFNLQDTYVKTKRIVESIFDEIIKFYAKKESQLQKISGLSKSEFELKIGDIIGSVETDYYKGNTGLSKLNEIFDVLQDNSEAQEAFFSKQNLSEMSKNWIEQQFKPFTYKKNSEKYGYTKGELKSSRMKDFKREASIGIVLVESYLKELLPEGATDEMFNEIMGLVLNGQTTKSPDQIKTNNKNTIEMIKALTKQEWDFINQFVKAGKPVTGKGAIKKAAGGQSGKARRGSFTSQAKSAFGSTLNEVSASRVVQSAIGASISNIVSFLDRELTGQVDKEIDVSDFVIKTVFEKTGKSVNIGVDAKYSFDPSKGGKVYSRSGSSVNKPVKELEPLFVDNQLQALTYLLTNLYYFAGESNSQYQKYFDDIIELIRLTAGLRTLLPTQQGRNINFSNPKTIKNFLTKDQRIFVLLNNKLFLMTIFLESVRWSLFTRSDNDLDSYKKIIMSNFQKILDNINGNKGIGELNAQGIPSGTYYNKKLKILSTLQKGSETYAELKTQASDKLTGTKIGQWKYKTFNIPLKINT